MLHSRNEIIFISSVAAVYSIPFQTYYSMTKSAINSLAMGLRNELCYFNVDVCAIMPGDIKTKFTESRIKDHEGSDVYNGMIDKSVAVMERDEQNGSGPDVIAKLVLKTAEKKKTSPIVTAGFTYKALVFLDRILPKKLVSFLLLKLYVKK